jgi:BolA family transcriptional regulator, general stress-responsive regulator
MTAIGDRATRAERIRAALATLEPQWLELTDDSHKHVGHAGARDGRGHFSVEMVSPRFEGLSLIGRHREVYSALGDLMQTDIHALQMKLHSPSEAGRLVTGKDAPNEELP